MNAQRVLSNFLEMVEIDSPSRKEKQMAKYCEKLLTKMGFEVYQDDSRDQTGSNADNLIAFLQGTTDGHVAFSAHMDCVEPCIGVKPQIIDGVITSKGDTVLGADDKAGLAAIFEGVQAVLESGEDRPDITLIITVCEELSLVGSQALPENMLPQSAPCFVLDAGGDPGTIIYGSPYHYTFEAEFHGVAAHAGAEPESGISAIQMASRAIESMKLGRLDECTTANIGMIEGGREINIVPDTCRITGECRSIYKDRVDDQLAAMNEAVQNAAAEFGGSVETSHILDYPGILFEKDDPLIEKLKFAAQNAGLTPQLAFSGGGADANIFQGKGMISITLAIGMNSYHALHESISTKDLEDSARFVEEIILTFAKQ